MDVHFLQKLLVSVRGDSSKYVFHECEKMVFLTELSGHRLLLNSPTSYKGSRIQCGKQHFPLLVEHLAGLGALSAAKWARTVEKERNILTLTQADSWLSFPCQTAHMSYPPSPLLPSPFPHCDLWNVFLAFFSYPETHSLLGFLCNSRCRQLLPHSAHLSRGFRRPPGCLSLPHSHSPLLSAPELILSG